MKNKFRLHPCFICMPIFVVAGCEVKGPSDVISESKMKNLLYDYHVTKSMGDNLPYSENYKKVSYIDAVFKKYGTIQATSDPPMVWYTRNAETLSKIYDEARKRLKDEQELVDDLVVKRDKGPKMTKQDDSIDVWPQQHMVRLTGEMVDNQYVFTLPTDSNYKDRDTPVWEVRYCSLESMLAGPLRGAIMAIQVICEKDMINHWKTVAKPGVQQIRLFTGTLDLMKEMKGSIYHPIDSQEEDGAVLADRPTMTRYHCMNTLAFAVRDSLNKIEILRTDSLKRIATKENADPLHKVIDKNKDDIQRLTPEEMSRRHTGTHREKKPEQTQVEQHIQKEWIEQKREHWMNQRRR